MHAPSPEDDREAWIRTKLRAGLPLDEAEKAYLATLPPDDPLLQLPPCPRKASP